MNDITKQLENLGQVRMSAEARSRAREKLDAYASFHPLGEGVTIREADRSREHIQHASVWSSLFTQTRLRTMKATLLATVLVLGGGGTAVAAQNAVPGDVLYPVKIGVNENIRSAFAIGANADARLQAELLAERVEEANTLAARGELSGEAAARAESNIAMQAEAAANAAVHADTDVRLAIASDVAAMVGGMRTALATETSARANDAFARLTATSDTMLAVSDDAQANAKASTMLAAEISVESRIERAEDRHAALTTVIGATSEFSAETRADFEAKLKTAAEYLTEARASLAADAQAAAEASVEAADELMGEVESALSLMGSIEIDAETGFITDIDLSGDVGSTVQGSTGGGVDGSAGAASGMNLGL